MNGEYVGKDGRTYRVYGISTYTDDTCHAGGLECVDLCPDAPDWPAARAALDALVEQESEEWVEIRQNDDEYTGLRCRVDGSQPQWFKDFDGKWHDEEAGEDTEWLVAYRKGREVALEEASDLRDATRELVEAIDEANSETRVLHLARPTRTEWENVCAAAKKMEGKL